MGNALAVERKVFCLQRRVRFEADHVATITQVEQRAFARAHRTTLQAVLIEVSGAEVLAVAAVLPLQVDRRHRLAFEVDLAEKVSAVLTLDWVLSRSKKTSFVFRTENSHISGSL